MLKIAEEKIKYYSALKEEIKIKYRSKREQEKLIKDKKSDEWTYYMSLKRQMVKKNARMQKQLNSMKQGETDDLVSEKQSIVDDEIKEKKRKSKIMQQAL